MCKKPDPDVEWQKGWGYTDIKENMPEAMAFPILWKPCIGKHNLVAWVHGGTITEVLDV